MIHANLAEEFHLYHPCPKGGPWTAASPGSLLTMQNLSSTQTQWIRICTLVRAPCDSGAHWNLRSTVLQLWQMPPTSPKSSLKLFYSLAIIKLSEAACSKSSPSFPGKAIKSPPTKYLWWAHSVLSVCRGRCIHEASSSPSHCFSSSTLPVYSACSQTIWLSDPFAILLQLIQVVKVILSKELSSLKSGT